jgi:hypothetical protein
MVLSNTRTGSQVLVEPGKTSFANGNIWFESFKDTPRIHRVWNEDIVEFHVIDMELLHQPSSPQPIPTIPFSTNLFNTGSVRAFRIIMPNGRSFTLSAFKSPLVIVGLSGTGAVNNKPFTKKGDYLFLPANSPQLAISNATGTAEAQFAIFVLN